MTSYQETHPPTLAEVAHTIGPEIAALVEAPAGTAIPVTGSALYDRSAAPARLPGAIALAIGIDPTGDAARAQFGALAYTGCVAVVYKAHGSSDSGLRTAARSASVALFRAADSVSWGQLAEIFAAATVPYGKAHSALADIRPGDLFELANTVASLASGAVAIADTDQTLLAFSTLPGQPIDDTRRNAILHLQVPHTDQNDLDYRRVHSSAGVLTIPPAEHSFSRSAVAIRAGNIVLGSLWLIVDESEAAGIDRVEDGADIDRVLLEAANVAALHLLHRRTNHDSGRARQIELVTPLLFEPERAELAAIQVGISGDALRIVAVAGWHPHASAIDSIQSGQQLFDAVRTACAVWLPGAVCGLADNIVYIVLPQPAASTTQAFHRAAILRIAHHTRRLLARPVLAGFGGECSIGTIAESRAEAEAVLAMLLRDVDDGRVRVDSDDIVADRDALGPRLQLRHAIEALRSAGLLPGEPANRIVDHDAARATFFEQTIRTWLDCGCNAIRTAERLGLHTNTVRYRLSRIEPLFGVNLDDPDTRLLVWLQLWSRSD